ncbi:MAG TPA: ABC transporter ATP-binding protein [Thermoanaerobaculia bacterium]|nr:ABC transporter ATP-binding protein [Thermoanaerobaculia bacterium]
MPPVLLARNLSKQFGKRVAVDDVSLELQRGEILGFLGPNGAGKTTTIRMLVGLIRPTRGSVQIGGHDLEREFEPAMRKVGCIVESPDLYRFLTGRENLEHFGRMLGTVSDQEIDEVAGIVGLSQRLDDLVKTYSLGMRQRLGIAQALLGSPELLILDEPANGLDPAGIREIRQLLRSLARERGLGILVSSHLLGEIEQMCDRVTIIHRGKTLAGGTVAELIAHRSRWRLLVDLPGEAQELLAVHGVESVRNDGWLEFGAEQSSIPSLMAALVAGGIGLETVQPHRQSLEERFLDETHGESV